jgi:SAM-dependent methyltransferase
MHIEAMDWLRRVKSLIGPRSRVCDLGSRNVNGGARDVFGDAAFYVGVDVRPGDGVDVVADAADWHLGPRLLFDLVVCTEVLEHAGNAAAICANAYRLLRSGGVFLVTAAGVKRAPHSVDGHKLPDGEHYAGVSEADLRAWLTGFAVVLIQDRDGQDIYALAMKG